MDGIQLTTGYFVEWNDESEEALNNSIQHLITSALMEHFSIHGPDKCWDHVATEIDHLTEKFSNNKEFMGALLYYLIKKRYDEIIEEVNKNVKDKGYVH